MPRDSHILSDFPRQPDWPAGWPSLLIALTPSLSPLTYHLSNISDLFTTIYYFYFNCHYFYYLLRQSSIPSFTSAVRYLPTWLSNWHRLANSARSEIKASLRHLVKAGLLFSLFIPVGLISHQSQPFLWAVVPRCCWRALCLARSTIAGPDIAEIQQCPDTWGQL